MPELVLENLTADHAQLCDGFICTTPTGETLASFLKTRALQEQNANCSTTLVLIDEARNRVDAFVTLSVASLVLPVRVRDRLQIPHSQVPAVLIGYLAVSDHVRGRGIGRAIF